MTKRISEGSYGILAEKKYDDEIGELIDSINEMSVKIGQAEKRRQNLFLPYLTSSGPPTAITGWSETLLMTTRFREIPDAAFKLSPRRLAA